MNDFLTLLLYPTLREFGVFFPFDKQKSITQPRKGIDLLIHASKFINNLANGNIPVWRRKGSVQFADPEAVLFVLEKRFCRRRSGKGDREKLMELYAANKIELELYLRRVSDFCISYVNASYDRNVDTAEFFYWLTSKQQCDRRVTRGQLDAGCSADEWKKTVFNRMELASLQQITLDKIDLLLNQQ